MSTFRGRNSLLQRFPLVYSRYNTNELSQKLAYDFVYDYTNLSSRKYSCEEKSVKDNTYLYYRTQDLVQILLASQGRHHKTYMYYNTCTRYLNSQSWQRLWGPQKIQRYYHNANIAASQVLVCVHGLVITVPLTLGIASNCLTCDNVYNWASVVIVIPRL